MSNISERIGHTETRSSSGCWTCRLRRKKCDEAHPRCISCNSLQISCFGYGQKPDWMDGGDMERAVAKATLDAVRQTTTRNRNRRLRRSQNLSNSAVSYKASTSSCIPASDIFDTDALAAELEQDVEFYETSMHDITTIAPQLPTTVDLNMISDETNSTFLQRTTLSPLAANIVVANDARTFSQDTSTSGESIEQIGANSIMEYLDSVFFLQFPLHDPLPTTGGRGWLLWILIHVRPLQTITDALCAQCHRSLQFQPGRTNLNFVQESEVEEKFSLLLSELNHHIGRVSLQNTNVREGKIGILACTVQLIFLEVFQGGSSTWRTHLEAASSLVAFLTAENFSCQDTNLLYSTTYGYALKFFSSLFVWFDVIAAASMGTKHLIPGQDERLLESNIADLGSLVGCENWIVLTILKTTALHHWKKDREGGGKLSLTELVRRSEPLERRLKQSLTRSPSSTYPSTITSDPSATQGNPQRDIITRIFAGSTLSYLHFVVSGAHPELIEMRESITITIEALKKLPHPWLLRSLAWPFCVTGCFALPEERGLLRNLVSAAGVNGPTDGNLWKALEVVEQCWKIQDSSLGLCDWTEAAASLGYDILFI